MNNSVIHSATANLFYSARSEQVLSDKLVSMTNFLQWNSGHNHFGRISLFSSIEMLSTYCWRRYNIWEKLSDLLLSMGLWNWLEYSLILLFDLLQNLAAYTLNFSNVQKICNDWLTLQKSHWHISKGIHYQFTLILSVYRTCKKFSKLDCNQVKYCSYPMLARLDSLLIC